MKKKELSKHKDQLKSSADQKQSKLASSSSQAHTNKEQKLVLQRNIKVYCWNVAASISRAARRDDLLPVLQRAQENKGTYAKDIAQHLLGEAVGREVVGQRLLSICESLGLLENQGVKRRPRFFLTDEGARALQSNSVMVPEEGTWTIWASDDPLLKYPVLRVEPLTEQTAFEELHPKNKKETQERNKNFENLPKWLTAACSRVAKPSAVGDKLMRLNSIEKKVERIDKHKSNLVIEWVPASDSLRLRGLIGSVSVDATPEAPGVTFKKVWNELLETAHLTSQWQESKQRLRVSFPSTTGAERSSMQRRLEFARPHLEQFGVFDKAYQQVNLFPQSLRDAQQWVSWNLKNKINTYAVKSEFTRWCQQVVQPFSEYSNEVTLPTRSQLAEAAWNDRHQGRQVANIWYLQAVEDWGI